MRPRRAVDASLEDWADIEDHGWSGLLLGNGASIAVWPRFKYASLYDTSLEQVDGLSDEDRALFEAFETKNFEAILSALGIAEIVSRHLELPRDEIRARYDSIQQSLIGAVNEIHVPWIEVPDETLRRIKDVLLLYDWVYSTNYDLLVYWAVMVDSPDGFKDFFWSEQFDITDTEIWDKVTKVLYLHGALHLYRMATGETLKRRAEERNLLEAFAAGDWRNALPLFIAEGSSEDKLRAIYGSDYLSFAFSRFSEHKGDLVVFGHSLGDTDKHLTEVMQTWSPKTLAISIRPGDEDEIIERKAHLKRRLKQHGLVFFDSTTHPLGIPELEVER